MEVFLSRAIIQHTLYLFISISLGFLLASFYSLKEACWLILVIYGFNFIPENASFYQRLTLLLFAALLLIAVLYWNYFFSFLNPFFSLLLITLLLMFKKRMPLFSNFFLFLVVFLFLLITAFQEVFSLEKSITLVIAALIIYLIAQLVIWPWFNSNKWYLYKKIVLQAAMKLNREVFKCVLNPDYLKNKYLVEKKIHLLKRKYAMAYSALNSLIDNSNYRANSKKHTEFVKQLSDINNIYLLIIEMGMVRFRVSDFTTFELCKIELKNIYAASNDLFLAIVFKKQFISNKLNDAIQRFEENFHQILQIAAVEPLVFYLFLTSIKLFSEQLFILYQDVKHI